MITPYVKINLNKVKANIQFMINQLRKYDIDHRPHIKPHKNIELAKLQLDMGAIGVTCASLSEMEVMVKGGIKNILLAMPLIGDEHWEKLYNVLHSHDVEFITIVDSKLGIEGLAKVGERLERPLHILVDVDSGGHREGIQSEDVLSLWKK